mgnify:CR=1 FL=1
MVIRGNTFFQNGAPVALTRNSGSYSHGAFELAENLGYSNALNAIVVHQTDRVLIENNILYANGNSPSKALWSGPSDAELVLNHSQARLIRIQLV